ncbi:MAG: hypothetical protein EXS05_17290 [Planctomycetaceae bacterium]|nr:hypothetical protein [Planctomycetaceae bacterium]
MYKALAFKELRETAWIGGLVVAAMLLVVLEQMGWHLFERRWLVPAPLPAGIVLSDPIPFVHRGLADGLAVIGICGALALGFRQVLGESIRGTWVFLLHRPAPRQALILTKIAVGAGLLFAASAVPVFVLAVWAATPGTHASPFDWRMTVYPLGVCLAATSLYLAAFLCSLRSAPWHGSRYLPLIAAALVMGWVYVTAWWPLTGWVVALVSDVVYLAAILNAAQTREYS